MAILYSFLFLFFAVSQLQPISGFLSLPPSPLSGLNFNLNLGPKGSSQGGQYQPHDCHHGPGEHPPPPFPPPYYSNENANQFPPQPPPPPPPQSNQYTRPAYRPSSSNPPSRTTEPPPISSSTENVDELINAIFNSTTPVGNSPNPETGEGIIDVRFKPSN